MTLRHLDLFSGIGGFALAAQMVGGIETQQFVEIEPYCQKVLAKNFPGVPIHDDITTYSALPGSFDLITFGSPCQDFSTANPNGRGLEGKRSGLFYEAIRVIRAVRPQYAIFENVANVLNKDGGWQFQQILRAFWESGFDAEWQTISAASVGAPHLRERVFIVAYSNRERCDNGRNPKREHAILLAQERQASQNQQQRDRRQCVSSQVCEADADTTGIRLQRRYSTRCDAKIVKPGICAELTRIHSGRNSWAVEPGILRVANGVPNRMDRIKGLGNAVVPQVAAIALQRVVDLDAV